MKVLIPGSIQIGGKTYSIERSVVPRYESLVGKHVPTRCQLLITDAKDVHPDELVSTFIHETIHAIDYVYGGAGEELSEGMTNAIAEGLHQVLKGLGIELVFEEANGK